MPPLTVRLGVTRNLHALVSPKRQPSQTHYEVDTFMVERMTLRIPVAACADAQRQAANTTEKATPAVRLLAGLPTLAKEATPDALTSVPLTATDPNERQVLQPVELPMAAFMQAVDAPNTAHTVVDGADALDQRDGWMANLMRVAQNPPKPLRAPKVSPRKKQTSPRRNKKKKKAQNLPPPPRGPLPAAPAALAPTLPSLDAVSKAAYHRLEAENVRLRRALAKARTPTTSVQPIDQSCQTDAPSPPATPSPPKAVVMDTPSAPRDENVEAGLAERIVRKERLEARRQVRALLGCEVPLYVEGNGSTTQDETCECEEGEHEDETSECEEDEHDTDDDRGCEPSCDTPPPTPPPPVPPPPVPPPPVPPPPVPPPPLAPPPLPPTTDSPAVLPTRRDPQK